PPFPEARNASKSHSASNSSSSSGMEMRGMGENIAAKLRRKGRSMLRPCYVSPMPRSYRWFITDVDGTLLDEANEIPPANRASLEELKRAGVPVVLATGRRWTTLKRVLDRLDLWNLVDYAIANNGAVI